MNDDFNRDSHNTKESMANIYIAKEKSSDLIVVYENSTAFDLKDVSFVLISKKKYQAIFLCLKDDTFVFTTLEQKAIELLLTHKTKTIILYNCSLENFASNIGKRCAIHFID